MFSTKNVWAIPSSYTTKNHNWKNIYKFPYNAIMILRHSQQQIQKSMYLVYLPKNSFSAQQKKSLEWYEGKFTFVDKLSL